MARRRPRWTSSRCAPLSTTTSEPHVHLLLPHAQILGSARDLDLHCPAKVPACALPWVATLPPFSRPVRALAQGPKCARFVTCRRVAWCPAPGCSFAVCCNGDFGHEPLDIACKCGSTFCFACKEEAHRPVRRRSPRRHHRHSSVRPDCP